MQMESGEINITRQLQAIPYVNDTTRKEVRSGCAAATNRQYLPGWEY